MSQNYDVAIVGAGIIGTSCALALAQDGLRVVLFDRGTPGREASWAAGGMLSPAPFLPCDEVLVPLALESLRLYPEFVESIESASSKLTNHSRAGAIELFFGPEAVAERDAYVARCNSLGVKAGAITATEARRREPAIASNARAAAFFPTEESVEPRALVEAALEAARNRGVEIRANYPIQSLILETNHCAGVASEGKRVHARHVVIAAGSFSRAIFDASANFGKGVVQIVPTRPVRGQMIALLSRDTTLSQVVRSAHGYLVPRSNGQIIAGSTLEEAGFDKQTTAEGLRQIRKAAVELVPTLDGAEIVESWAGLRPGTPDGLPILGPAGMPGLIIATGHFRNGILLAPVTAQLVRDWVRHQTPRFPVEAFSPLRFAGSAA
jgi:glycine oxidase